MNEPEILIDLLERKQPLVAMLAPSFPIVYQHPNIIGKLKRLGFEYVIEVSAGAKNTNSAALKILTENPKARIITSPCASFVRMIRTKHPHLIKYLGFAADSPMVATARIAKEKYPGFRPIFIGPCNAKKLEANEDYPELEIVSVTYRQMKDVFEHFKIEDELEYKVNSEGREGALGYKNAKFDIEEVNTRLYPISGGLAQSSLVKDFLADDEIEVVSGWQNCEDALKRFETNDRIRLLDILFCDGGCINGPGIDSPLNTEQRREKVINFWKKGTDKSFFTTIKKMLAGLKKSRL